MFNRIHQKLGTAGFIISIVALVAALGGGAYAASGGLSGKQKKEVEKIAKKYAGKPGAEGKQGLAGATGPAGAAGGKGEAGANGDAGEAGAKGDRGETGEQGEPGESVTVTSIASGGSQCSGRAGAEVTEAGAASGVEVCEGAKGAEGQTGFASTLPEGATETGSWMSPYFHGHYTAETEFPLVSVSFPFPLPSGQAILAEYVPVTREAVTTNCPGTASAPEAAEGWLCIYRGSNGLNTSEAKLTLQAAATSPDGARHELSVNSPETGVSTTTVAPTGFAFGMFETAAAAGKATFASGTWALTSQEH